MVAMYTVAGRQVGSHILAIATLGTTFAGAAFALSGGSKEKKPTPPINATSQDEEKFIKEFIQSTNMDSLKEKH